MTRGRPEESADLSADAARAEPEPAQLTGGSLVVVQPRGRRVAGQLEHRLVAERSRCPQRVAGVANELRIPRSDELEQVLDAVDLGRRHEGELPRAAAEARELARRLPLPDLGDEPHRAQRSRVLEPEDDLLRVPGGGLHAARW
jgi:hypothetical protein